MPGPVLGTAVASINKRDKNPCRVCILMGREWEDNKYNKLYSMMGVIGAMEKNTAREESIEMGVWQF